MLVDDHEDERPFVLASRSLRAIGALSVDQFLHASAAESLVHDAPEVLKSISRRTSTNTPPSPVGSDVSMLDVKVDYPPQMEPYWPIKHLLYAYQRAFDSDDGLKFEFNGEHGKSNFQCTLTLTRPDRASKSYTTQPIFVGQEDAKLHAAKLAIDQGALEFIIQGRKAPVLAPLDGPGSCDSHAGIPEQEGTSVRRIEERCVQWRGGEVKPRWISFADSRPPNRHGCLLQIKLSPHSCRLYSCSPSHETILAAKKACADIAVEQGVLGFIMCGDEDTKDVTMDNSASTPPAKGLSLKEFYESLPRPFPESFGEKPDVETLGPGWLNSAIQGARGSRLVANFYFFMNHAFSLHGCILRLERPEDCKSYLVEPYFLKRVDAKAAVCLQAMSEGVGNYIREVTDAIDRRLTKPMRDWGINEVIPTLQAEHRRAGLGLHLDYSFDKDTEAYGSTLKVQLSSNPNLPEVRTWTVPIGYRTKTDAKVAVSCLAAEQGAIEFIRFQGHPPPASWVPLAPRRSDSTEVSQTAKSKDADVVAAVSKKGKTLNKSSAKDHRQHQDAKQFPTRRPRNSGGGKYNTGMRGAGYHRNRPLHSRGGDGDALWNPAHAGPSANQHHHTPEYGGGLPASGFRPQIFNSGGGHRYPAYPYQERLGYGEEVQGPHLVGSLYAQYPPPPPSEPFRYPPPSPRFHGYDAGPAYPGSSYGGPSSHAYHHPAPPPPPQPQPSPAQYLPPLPYPPYPEYHQPSHGPPPYWDHPSPTSPPGWPR